MSVGTSSTTVVNEIKFRHVAQVSLQELLEHMEAGNVSDYGIGGAGKDKRRFVYYLIGDIRYYGYVPHSAENTKLERRIDLAWETPRTNKVSDQTKPKEA